MQVRYIMFVNTSSLRLVVQYQSNFPSCCPNSSFGVW